MRYITNRNVALARYRTRLAKDDWREERLSEPKAVMKVARLLVTAENPDASPARIEELVGRRMHHTPKYGECSGSKVILPPEQINADRRKIENRKWKRRR